MNHQLNKEVNAVKELGESIGYGHLMELASALWRKSLNEDGFPADGAFITSLLIGFKDDWKNNAIETCTMYDNIVEQNL